MLFRSVSPLSVQANQHPTASSPLALSTPASPSSISEDREKSHVTQSEAQIPANVPIWQKYILTKIANGSNTCASVNGCWQVTNPHNQRSTFVPASASSSQDVIIDTLPAGSYLTSLREQTATSCTGVGLSAVTSTIGTTTGDAWFLAIPYDLTATPSGTNFQPSNGNLMRSGSLTSYGDTLVMGINTTGGNVSAIAAGCKVSLVILYSIVP